MNLKNFQTQISKTILNRGKEYYNEGAVSIVEEQEDGIWCAEVEGSETYSVEVELSAGGEIDSYTCDCPHEADVCKHIVAVFYELKDRAKIIKVQPEKKGKKQALTFNELLEKVSFAELKQFVTQYAANDKNLKANFELYFAHKDEHIDVEKKYGDLIRKAIRSSMSHGYVDYYSAGDLSRKVDHFLNKAQEAFENRNFKDASIIARVALKQLVEEVIPSADDSDGDIDGSIYNATAILKSIIESELCPHELLRSLHDFLADELINENYFDYGDFGYDLFDVFRKLSVRLNNGEAILHFTRLFPIRPAEERVNNYRAEFFIKQTIRFYRETGNLKEKEKWIRQNMEIVDVRKEMVDDQIEQKNYLEAKKLVYDGIVIAERKQHPGTVSEWQKTLLTIADLEGDVAMQRHLNLLFAFDHYFHPEYYQNWKKTFSKTEWETEFRTLVQSIIDEVEVQAEKNLNNHWWSKNQTLLNRLAPIYVEEKLWYQLYQLVEAYPSLEVLLNYMKHLAKDYHAQLTDLLFPALILAGDRADSRSGYARVAAHMKDVMKLMPASRSKVLEAAQVLRAKYPRKPAMQDELKAVK